MVDIQDSDTLQTPRHWWNVTHPFGGLCAERDGFIYSPSVGHAVCETCGHPMYFIDLDLIERGTIRKQWVERYFWGHGSTSSRDRVSLYEYRPKLRVSPVPDSWIGTQVMTSRGIFYQHRLGPFSLTEEFGPYFATESLDRGNGAVSCQGGPIWKHAADIVGQLWMLVTTFDWIEDADWFEPDDDEIAEMGLDDLFEPDDPDQMQFAFMTSPEHGDSDDEIPF